MDKEHFIKLLEHLNEIYAQDREDNQAWRDFIKVIAPNEYAPIVEWKLSTVLGVLKIEYPDIVEWLSYYFFEAKWMKSPIVTDKNGKEYNYSKKEDVIQSMLDFQYITP